MTRPAVFSRSLRLHARGEGPARPLAPPERHRSSQPGSSRHLPIRELRPPSLLVSPWATPKTPDRIFAPYTRVETTPPLVIVFAEVNQVLKLVPIVFREAEPVQDSESDVATPPSPPLL
jgi:hypothetical protein